jgi:predicted O-methyltransferase YrrM
MDATTQKIIDDLLVAAEEHDAKQADRLDRWRVLEPDAGRLLWFLAQSLAARTIVEIGTSRGVSTLWLADAARGTGGHVLSVDVDAEAQEAARGSLQGAGLAEQVTFRSGDGGAVLAELADGSVDLLFLDAERTEYPAWWPHPMRVLRPGGLLVADNATSHPEEIAPLRDLVEAEPGMVTITVGVGKGELLALRR